MGVVWANETYPETCSCGFNYKEKNMSYREHLDKSHAIKIEKKHDE